ncbi:Filamin-A [Nymphon striatum]|nr:Filamin-A [Nymphon striatum]
MGNHIAKSPFKIQVGEREIGDANKVKVSGDALKAGKTQQLNEFSINTKDAGYGGLSLSIEGPSKADIQCKDNENGTLNVSYKPTEPGYYIVNLKFADHHVPGSPFTVKVAGEGSGSQTERIKRDREAVPITEVGNECKFTFRLPGTTPYDLVARVTSPNGTTEDAEIIDLNDSTFAVHFFTVGPLKEGGSHKVHAGGLGLERGEINKSCEFNVWTREAGAGHLAISVEGPSKAEIDFQDRKDGSCYVTYNVAEQGFLSLTIKHIPDSPYKVYITPGMADANKVTVGNLLENDLQMNKPISFVIHMNGAKGTPDGQVIGPSGEEDDCFISPVDDEQYALRFVPKMNGVHNVHLKLLGAHIPESPLRLRVGKDEADPAIVTAFGNGLIGTKTGHKADFIVDTCNAGSGTLAVTIDGPSKVSMDCTEVEDGYKVRYTPLAPGEYFVTVKYSGYHIVGSPFRVPCSGKAVAESSYGETSSVVVETHVKESKFKSAGIVLPKFNSDASKVTCKGLGLRKSHLNKQNQFNVNCADAGNNMLYVSVYGPKSPVEEVYVKHMGNHAFIVNYLAKERGEHFVVIKYGEDNIPGSPFRVDVL